MATVITRYIDPTATGADDGTSLSDAYTTLEDAISDIVSDYADFTSSDVQVDLLCTGTIDSTGSPDFSSTCDATRFLRIKPYQAGDINSTGIWDPSTYTVIRNASNNGSLLRVNTGAWVEVEDLQLGNNKSGATSFGRIIARSGEGTVRVRRCWLKQMTSLDSNGSGNDVDTGFYFNAAFDLEVYDSIIEGFTHAIRNNTSSHDPKFINCLFKDNDTDIYTLSGGDVLAKNCIFHGATTGVIDGTGSFSASSDYNATDQASAPTNFGSNSLANQTISFVSSTDYQLNASDTALHAAGIGTTDSDVQSTDKLGVSRGSSTASIGPFEYAAAASATPSISAINTSTLVNGRTAVNLTGTDFGTATGVVTISSENSLSGSVTTAITPSGWADTSASFTASRGSIQLLTDAFMFVTSDAGDTNTDGATVSFTPIVTIEDSFRDISATALASLSNLSVLIWHDVPTGAPDEVLAAQALDGAGAASWEISAGSLSVDDPVWYSIFDSAGGSVATSYKTTPTYS